MILVKGKSEKYLLTRRKAAIRQIPGKTWGGDFTHQPASSALA
jgi:hypothetical protein